MKTLALIASMLLAITAHAQQTVCSPTWTSKVNLDCQLGDNQANARCLADRAAQADAEMNRLVQILKSDLMQPADLSNAQRNWSNFRGSECRYQASGATCETGKSGSACTIASTRCQVKLTCDRVAQLHEHMGNICTDCPPRKSASR